jgi:hypothetical protein
MELGHRKLELRKKCSQKFWWNSFDLQIDELYLQKVVLLQSILKRDKNMLKTFIVFLEVLKPGYEIFTHIFIH